MYGITSTVSEYSFHLVPSLIATIPDICGTFSVQRSLFLSLYCMHACAESLQLALLNWGTLAKKIILILVHEEFYEVKIIIMTVPACTLA